MQITNQIVVRKRLANFVGFLNLEVLGPDCGGFKDFLVDGGFLFRLFDKSIQTFILITDLVSVTHRTIIVLLHALAHGEEGLHVEAFFYLMQHLLSLLNLIPWIVFPHH